MDIISDIPKTKKNNNAKVLLLLMKRQEMDEQINSSKNPT